MRRGANSRLITARLLTGFFISWNCIVLAGPGNIAQLAKASASAELSSDYSANNVNDRLIGISDMGEWASNSKLIFGVALIIPGFNSIGKKASLLIKLFFMTATA